MSNSHELPTEHCAASVEPSAQLGENVKVQPGSYVGKNTRIGSGSQIGRNVVIYADTLIGRDTVIFDNSVLGRPPLHPRSVRSFPTDLQPLVIGDRCIVGVGAVIYRGSTIGDETMVADGASIRELVVVGTRVLIARLVTINSQTVIGNDVSIMDNSHITGDCLIEDEVFVGTGVATTNGPAKTNPSKSEATFGGPKIRRGANIGSNCTLLPGIEIGSGAIVGAGAVVTKDVEPMNRVMGVPARKM